MNTLIIHKTTYDSTNYGWLEYGLEYWIGNAEIHRKFSSSPIHCALDYEISMEEERLNINQGIKMIFFCSKNNFSNNVLKSNATRYYSVMQT